jgi:hypothetical protein
VQRLRPGCRCAARRSARSNVDRRERINGAGRGSPGFVASIRSAPDVAWFHPEPLHDALRVKDLICFCRPATIRVDGVSVDTAMPGE